MPRAHGRASIDIATCIRTLTFTNPRIYIQRSMESHSHPSDQDLDIHEPSSNSSVSEASAEGRSSSCEIIVFFPNSTQKCISGLTILCARFTTHLIEQIGPQLARRRMVVRMTTRQYQRAVLTNPWYGSTNVYIQSRPHIIQGCDSHAKPSHRCSV